MRINSFVPENLCTLVQSYKADNRLIIRSFSCFNPHGFVKSGTLEELSAEELSVLSVEELSELLEFSSELSGVLTETVISDIFSVGNSVFDLHPQRETAKTSAALIFNINDYNIKLTFCQ